MQRVLFHDNRPARIMAHTLKPPKCNIEESTYGLWQKPRDEDIWAFCLMVSHLLPFFSTSRQVRLHILTDGQICRVIMYCGPAGSTLANVTQAHWWETDSGFVWLHSTSLNLSEVVSTCDDLRGLSCVNFGQVQIRMLDCEDNFSS